MIVPCWFTLAAALVLAVRYTAYWSMVRTCVLSHGLCVVMLRDCAFFLWRSTCFLMMCLWLADLPRFSYGLI
jgi:hypothetical protein